LRSGGFDSHPEVVERCWAFVRGDLDISSFENWLYSDKVAELALGPDGFLGAVSTDFGDPKRVADLRHHLSELLPAPAACSCHRQASQHLVTMGALSLDAFDHVERGVLHMFWMHRFNCRACATEWWLLEEGRIYDVWILFRGGTNRPAVESYRELLSLAILMGASVQYFQPQVSVEIPATIEDLARETPGIAVSELARLISIPLGVVRKHAQRILEDTALNIDLEN
jgi:hypothetical protein